MDSGPFPLWIVPLKKSTASVLFYAVITHREIFFLPVGNAVDTKLTYGGRDCAARDVIQMAPNATEPTNLNRIDERLWENTMVEKKMFTVSLSVTNRFHAHYHPATTKNHRWCALSVEA